MAQLSKRLTRFARRSGDDVRPVDLDQVLSEAARTAGDQNVHGPILDLGPL